MIENVGVTISIVATRQNLKIAIVTRDGHVPVQHVLTRQMNHRDIGIVEHCQ